MEQSQKLVSELVEDFKANEHAYLSPSYQESQVRQDFIDKFFSALGWDVTHNIQKNPYQQEVKIENKVTVGSSQRRADYAFSIAPNFEQVKFFVEAKKPSRSLANPDDYFQTIRYAWNTKTPISVLTDFEEFHILDCRHKPKIDDALNRKIESFHYSDYTKEEIFAKIYHLFARDAVLSGSLDQFISQLQKRIGKTHANYQPVDDAFLEELDEYRVTLAKAFKKTNERLQGEELTEAVQRTIDRLVFIRFLEDKGIEDRQIVKLANQKSPWQAFVALCKRLDPKYNGLVFKTHRILDSGEFNSPDEKPFAQICRELSDPASPYDFNQIPVSILGSIYERFLGKVVHATDKRVKVEEKPEVRKAGGVYYTPEYIVRYIVKETVGKLIESKTPKDISKMAFADIACGSGSFLIEVYQELLDCHIRYYNAHPDEATDENTFTRNGMLQLTLKLKKEILVNNIYGVDLDYQATEVTQMSLYLKMLEQATMQDAHQFGLFKERILPDLRKNIVCGNSLIGRDIVDEELFSTIYEKQYKPMDYKDVFPLVMNRGGFDAIVGNPPYALIGSDRKIEHEYYNSGRFELTAYKTNTYVLFLDKGLRLLKPPSGKLGLIIPKSLVFNTHFENTRKKLIASYAIQSIIEIREKVFSNAEVGDSILLFVDRSPEIDNNKIDYKIVSNIFPVFDVIETYLSNQKELRDSGEGRFYNSGISVIVPTVRLDQKCAVSNGLNPGNIRHILFSNHNASPKHKRLLLGRDVQRYHLNWSGTWVNYDANLKVTVTLSETKSKPGMTAQGKVDFALRDPQIYNAPKIVIRKTADRIIAAYDSEGFFFDSLSYGIQLHKETRESIYYFLGLLNSTLIKYIHANLSQNKDKVFAKVLAENLKKLPIRSIEFENKEEIILHDEIVNLVRQLLTTIETCSRANTESEITRLDQHINLLERQIDQIVYTLYGLTEDQIHLLEN